MWKTILFTVTIVASWAVAVPGSEGSRASPSRPAMGQPPTKTLFGKRPALVVPAPMGPKTNDVWFTADGVPTHSAIQGQILTWAADCQTLDTLQWDIWADVNGNGQLDTTGSARDIHLGGYRIANGDTAGNQGLPDTTHIPDNQIVNRMKWTFAPTLYWFRATSVVDGTWAVDTLRVHPLPMPWATASGHVHVPGDSALQAGLWVEAGLSDMATWAGITDQHGDYVINFDSEIQNQEWEVGNLDDLVGASGAYVAPSNIQVLVTAGPHPGVNFNYIAATDSITGDVTRHPSGSLPFEVYVWCQNRQTGRDKGAETVNGRYQLFFAAPDTGLWDLNLWWDDNIAGYMRPNSRNDLQPVGAGHLVENFTVYPADVTVQGTITENGGPPANQYRVTAWSHDYQMSNHVISQAGTGSYSLPVSDVESMYSINIANWDDEHPIPTGWIVSPQGYYPVNPPATGLDFNLTPATEAISGTITQDAGDPVLIDFTQIWIHASGRQPGNNFGTSPDGSGWYFMPVVSDTYYIGAGCPGFLFKPFAIWELAVPPNDTAEGVNFIANYGHCRVEATLVGYPAGHAGWMNAGDAAIWPNGYHTNTQVTGPGTQNLYICNSTGWTLYAPGADGYNVAPGSYAIGDIAHSDTYRGPYTFTYTPTGVAGKPEAALPKTFALSQNRPNPVSSSSDISFQLPVRSDVSLTVYNILGQEVKTWRKGTMEPGCHSVRWDGRDMRGDKASNGVYFYRLKAGDFTATRRLSVLR